MLIVVGGWICLAVGVLALAGMALRRFGPFWPGAGVHARHRGAGTPGEPQPGWDDLFVMSSVTLTGVLALTNSSAARWLEGAIAAGFLAWQLDRWVRSRARRQQDGQAGNP